MIRGAVCKECGGDLWEEYPQTLQCTNCLTERPYHRRKPGNSITPSQRNKANEIKHYFDGSRFNGEPTTKITEWKEELQEETGHLYISVETGNGLWDKDGGYFKIGRRGGLTVLMTYRISNRKETVEHYAKILRGKVSKET